MTNVLTKKLGGNSIIRIRDRKDRSFYYTCQVKFIYLLYNFFSDNLLFVHQQIFSRIFLLAEQFYPLCIFPQKVFQNIKNNLNRIICFTPLLMYREVKSPDINKERRSVIENRIYSNHKKMVFKSFRVDTA
jgi:hypothetical protein